MTHEAIHQDVKLGRGVHAAVRPDGLVLEQRDYWSMHPGRTDPKF